MYACHQCEVMCLSPLHSNNLDSKSLSTIILFIHVPFHQHICYPSRCLFFPFLMTHTHCLYMEPKVPWKVCTLSLKRQSNVWALQLENIYIGEHNLIEIYMENIFSVLRNLWYFVESLLCFLFKWRQLTKVKFSHNPYAPPYYTISISHYGRPYLLTWTVGSKPIDFVRWL